mgnify:CR=1 FL=1
MTLQKVLSRVRQAVADYHMIEEGDRIAVGISGGKDSLTLLLALYQQVLSEAFYSYCSHSQSWISESESE